MPYIFWYHDFLARWEKLHCGKGKVLNLLKNITEKKSCHRVIHLQLQQQQNYHDKTRA